MTSRSVGVATETLSYCTSCKMDLNHVVVAMKGDKIAKVQCLTCKKEHMYRAPKGATEPTVKASKSRSSKSAASDAADGPHPIELEWEKLMASHKDVPSKAYSTKGQFLLGDRINHPVFGDGIVGRLIYPNKLEVIFRNDVKVLIHAGG